MKTKLKKRQDRRDRTERKARQRWREVARGGRLLFGPGHNPALSPGHYRKRPSFGCNCRTKARGNPKCGGGICYALMTRPALTARVHGKRIERVWRREAQGVPFEALWGVWSRHERV